jgi:hypothetical protein
VAHRKEAAFRIRADFARRIERADDDDAFPDRLLKPLPIVGAAEQEDVVAALSRRLRRFERVGAFGPPFMARLVIAVVPPRLLRPEDAALLCARLVLRRDVRGVVALAAAVFDEVGRKPLAHEFDV